MGASVAQHSHHHHTIIFGDRRKNKRGYIFIFTCVYGMIEEVKAHEIYPEDISFIPNKTLIAFPSQYSHPASHPPSHTTGHTARQSVCTPHRP